MPRIYLAGPITGMTYNEADAWRQETIRELSPYGIECLSPLRAEHDPARKIDEKLNYQDACQRDPALLKVRGIIRRDESDVRRSDLILANFIGAKIVSIGTVSELGWSHILHIPSVMVCPPGNIHYHDWLIEQVDWTVDTLEEAHRIIRKVLLPDYD